MYEHKVNSPYVLRTKIKNNIWLHVSDNDNVVVETRVKDMVIGTRLTDLHFSESWIEIDTNKNINTPNVFLIRTRYWTPPDFVM